MVPELTLWELHIVYLSNNNNNNKYIFSAKILVKYNIQNFVISITILGMTYIKLRWETLKITEIINKTKGPI